ncbi:MAG: class I SAM-dependent RNA methyltransferase [Oscillospiraceae bacterium]|nr:class I SAM-dependent RNA methyltransferase [Oscillospiraceae bacterium]
MDNTVTLTCPCHFGLESTLKFEVKRMGGENITVTDGRVTFTGDISMIARANICLATAERVQILLAQFPAHTFDELFEGVRAIPLERFILKDSAFPIKGHSLNSALSSVPACQSIIKKATVKRLSSVYGIEYFEEIGAPRQIQFNILKNNVTVMLDTSGEGLHKRGYRKNSNAAPIKETLAAGIIDFAKVKRNTIFCDPFCGSRTFLIEAAYKALNIAPGLKRTFSAEKWETLPSHIWVEERSRAMDNIVRDSDFFAYGSDNDPESVQLALSNCAKAGMRKRINIIKADVSEFSPRENSVTVCNPPYGERMLEIKDAERLYSIMGSVFSPSAEHQCHIITPHEDFESFFGRKADKTRKLYNGMIKCNLFSYYK